MLFQNKLCVVFVIAAFISGCGQNEGVNPTAIPETQPVRKVNAAAAERGYINMTTKDYGDPFMTEFLFNNLYVAWDQESKELAEKATTEERRKMTMERYGFYEAPFDNEGVPLGLKKRPDGTWATTCFTCHAGSLNGKVVLGLGNNQLDLINWSLDVHKARKILEPIWEGPTLPPITAPALPLNNIFKGTNHAGLVTPIFLSFRDSDLNMLMQPRDMGKIFPFPDDTPAWWNVWKKKRLYALNTIEFNQRPLMQFMTIPGLPKELIYASEDDFKDIAEWVNSMRSETSVGKFTGQIDSSRVARGEKVFNDTCMRCHGTYNRPDWTYPERVVDLQNIGTDPANYLGITPEYSKAYSDSWFSFYSGVYNKSAGYVAPPLDGVWATAPYLHNGAVPTLAHMLKIEERPTIWKVKQYNLMDFNRVGLDIEEFDEVPSNLTLTEQLKYYNTSAIGGSNKGHDYPDELTLEQKRDVLEYLKTL